MVKKMAETVNISDVTSYERQATPTRIMSNSGIRQNSGNRESRQNTGHREPQDMRPPSTLEGTLDTNKEFQVQPELMNTIDDENAGTGVITKSKRAKKSRPIASPDDAMVVRSPEDPNTPALSKRLDSENLLRDSVGPRMKPDLDNLDFRDVERVVEPNTHKQPHRLPPPVNTFPETPQFSSHKDATTKQLKHP